jgi:hypothetical protein
MNSPFLVRLSEAARWCALRLDLDVASKALRSAELAPPCDGEWDAIVASVCERRARLLNAQSPRPLLPPAGNLLIFDPGQSLSDGAAMVESSGFFDADNTPPWDTWVAYVREEPRRSNSWSRLDSYLLCWIPSPFVSLVDRAIDVNPEGCLLWGDQADTPFLRHWCAAELASNLRQGT